MSESEIWRGPNGDPLQFQDGDYVRIDTTDHPERAYTLRFLEGYVRGYDISGGRGSDVAYELFKMGESPLRWVREEFLIPAPELLPDHQHPSARSCGICGRGGSPSDAKTCEMCNGKIPKGADGRDVSLYFCSPGCGDAYVKSWE